MNDKRQQLCSSFNVDCRLASSFAQLEKLISLNPSLKLLSRGSRLRYRVDNSDGFRRVVEFERESIRFVFYFDGNASSAYNKNLMMFLVILGLVDRQYEVALASVYGYMAEALKNSLGGIVSDERQRTIGRQGRLLEALTGANRQLSKELLGYRRALDEMKETVLMYRHFCAQLVEKLSRNRTDAAKELAVAFGVDSNEAQKVLFDLDKR